MPYRFACLLLTAVAVALLAGCGGDEPSTPDGYATYDGEHATFAYPKGWKATRGERGAVVLRPPGVGDDEAAPQVELSVFPLDGQAFDDFVEQSESVLETVIASRDGKREDFDADPEGADESVAREVNYTGIDGKPYRTVSVTARVGETVVSLAAGGRPGDDLDIDGVIASFQLKP